MLSLLIAVEVVLGFGDWLFVLFCCCEIEFEVCMFVNGFEFG